MVKTNGDVFRKTLSEKNYVVKADRRSRYWFGLSKTKINKYLNLFEDHFNIIIFGEDSNDADYYIIPFTAIKDLFRENTLSISARYKRERWVGDIISHSFRVRNSLSACNVADFYCTSFATYHNINPLLSHQFSAEDIERLSKVRTKQSIFRARVLMNFNNRCCLTDVVEENLLVASHIIPWADGKDMRLNPSNGLCLSVLYDKLFDNGYFTVNFEGLVVISNREGQLSPYIKKALSEIRGKYIKSPLYFLISKEALIYHHSKIFDKFEILQS